jgi:uncharacterized protein YuzE
MPEPQRKKVSSRKGIFQKINFSYDGDADVMYFYVGRPRPSKTVEVGDDFVLRLDPRTGRVIGLTVVDFSKHFDLKGLKAKLPARGTFGPDTLVRSLASA